MTVHVRVLPFSGLDPDGAPPSAFVAIIRGRLEHELVVVSARGKVFVLGRHMWFSPRWLISSWPVDLQLSDLLRTDQHRLEQVASSLDSNVCGLARPALRKDLKAVKELLGRQPGGESLWKCAKLFRELEGDALSGVASTDFRDALKWLLPRATRSPRLNALRLEPAATLWALRHADFVRDSADRRSARSYLEHLHSLPAPPLRAAAMKALKLSSGDVRSLNRARWPAGYISFARDVYPHIPPDWRPRQFNFEALNVPWQHWLCLFDQPQLLDLPADAMRLHLQEFAETVARTLRPARRRAVAMREPVSAHRNYLLRRTAGVMLRTMLRGVGTEPDRVLLHRHLCRMSIDERDELLLNLLKTRSALAGVQGEINRYLDELRAEQRYAAMNAQEFLAPAFSKFEQHPLVWPQSLAECKAAGAPEQFSNCLAGQAGTEIWTNVLTGHYILVLLDWPARAAALMKVLSPRQVDERVSLEMIQLAGPANSSVSRRTHSFVQRLMISIRSFLNRHYSAFRTFPTGQIRDAVAAICRDQRHDLECVRALFPQLSLTGASTDGKGPDMSDELTCHTPNEHRR